MIKKKNKQKIGYVQQKILLLLLGGVLLGLTQSPKRYYRTFTVLRKEWQSINRRALDDAINALYRSQLIEMKENADGTTTALLSKRGRQFAITRNIRHLKIQRMSTWDKKWRIVIFDIPESSKTSRDSLRLHLKQMGFIELQKSVFVCPWQCANELDFIIEYHNLRKYVRSIIAETIDNELALKKEFKL
ncbi:MAG: CRISPR-associated endonuclease Cas2 [Candidatus Taylorbacteria bacterium RIFCSPLOWO2_01_FULL_45_15b]|uniref:CRISPR-associated endonuclease Cas2 n=1 Tax=Candidatus Taylorbacteria bacterium RIFCSPLOWO2_01_FULL_45_15b TaxID=1802319 RepID=A0A1G2NHP3_9BACT|nr:MAG: CRISPR-associated endonuclease Cas2 [Candidatus Taylorbacteria bacterium RIFCSPLOWO2_01_FULL_45_15b]